MRIHLERFGFGTDSTIGKLYVPGLEPVWTLEDQYQERKVYGETCIWEGTYELALRREGGMHPDYAERFPSMHRGMIHLLNVRDFEWIYIHILNRDDQTFGCIGVGERGRMNEKGEFSVGRSEDAYRRIYTTVADAIESDEGCEIRIARRWEQLAA